MGLLNSGSARDPGIDALWVVVPCNNEADLLGRCLRSVAAARAAVRSARAARSGRSGRSEAAPVDVRVALVLDDCTDGSAAVAAAAPDVVTVRVRHRSVGRARAAGVAALRAGEVPGAGQDARRTWIACTDADSEVPTDWLTLHLAYAAAGADLLLGTVVPDADGLDASGLAEWHRLHPVGPTHDRVHGANLGVRLSAYDRVGGFEPLAADEDVALVRRVRALPDAAVLTTHAAPVRTSSRRRGRAPAGFAGYVTTLAADLPGEESAVAAARIGPAS